MLTFISGVIGAALVFLAAWIADRSKREIATKELETKIAMDRADDIVLLEKTKIETIREAMSTSAAQVERVMQPVISREVEARIKLENDVIHLTSKVSALQRELNIALRDRCPMPNCPVFRPYAGSDNNGPL